MAPPLAHGAPDPLRPALVAGLVLAVVAATLAVYLPVRDHAYLPYDDDVHVTANARVLSGLSAENLGWALTTTHGGYWHPLTWLSHQADVALFGPGPAAPHLVNAVLHALNAALVLLLLLRLTGRPWPSGLVAALFALHPLHVESVAWVAQRKDVLSTLLVLLATLAWLPYARTGSRAAYAGSLGLFALALAAKPMAVTFPLLLLALDLWPLRRLATAAARRRALLEKAPFLALSLGAGIAAVAAQRAGGALATLEAAPVASRAANAAASLVAYLRQTVWPDDLAVLYPYPRGPVEWGTLAFHAALLAGLAFLAVRAGRRRPWLPAGGLWFLVALLPVLGLLQTGVQARADRYTYVALLGPFWVAALAAADAGAAARWAHRLLPGLALGVLLLLAWTSSRQVSRWKDADALFRHTLAVTSDNGFVRQVYATWLLGRGRAAEALPHFDEAMRLLPRSADVAVNRANALRALAREAEALQGYRQAVALDPRSPLAHYNLGVALAARGDVAEAIAHYTTAIRLEPDLAKARANLGLLLARQGRPDAAIPHLREAVALDPGDAESWTILGTVLAGAGEVGAAREALERALRLDPLHPRARAALEALPPGLR